MRLQQGRVDTDNDWNEGTDERARNVYDTTADALKPVNPARVPDWTDQSRSDPGMTLVELLAFLAVALAGGIAARWLRNRSSNPTFSVSVDGHPWHPVESLEEAGPDERVYRVDTETATVVFGDGVHGRVPDRGVTIETSYEHGGGVAGAIGWTASAVCLLWLCKRLIRRQL